MIEIILIRWRTDVNLFDIEILIFFVWLGFKLRIAYDSFNIKDE